MRRFSLVELKSVTRTLDNKSSRIMRFNVPFKQGGLKGGVGGGLPDL